MSKIIRMDNCIKCASCFYEDNESIINGKFVQSWYSNTTYHDKNDILRWKKDGAVVSTKKAYVCYYNSIPLETHLKDGEQRDYIKIPDGCEMPKTENKGERYRTMSHCYNDNPLEMECDYGGWRLEKNPTYKTDKDCFWYRYYACEKLGVLVPKHPESGPSPSVSIPKECELEDE